MEISLIEKILSGNAGEGEKEMFELWLDESTENKEYFKQIEIIWNHLDGVYNKSEFNLEIARLNIQSKIRSKKKNTKKVNFWYRSIAVASVLLLIVSGIYYLKQTSFGNTEAIEYASLEEIRKIQLPDGSQVWLNDHSSLTTSNNSFLNDRNVTLNGEAYFEVKSDPKHPFKIKTGLTVTEVLGTSFNIKSDTLGCVQLIVNHGKVGFYELKNRKNRILLQSNDMARYDPKEHYIEKSINQDMNYLAWKTGILTFNNCPIENVCNTLSNHYKEKVYSSISGKNLKITGTFDNESLDEILATIALTLDVKIERQNGEMIISN